MFQKWTFCLLILTYFISSRVIGNRTFRRQDSSELDKRSTEKEKLTGLPSIDKNIEDLTEDDIEEWSKKAVTYMEQRIGKINKALKEIPLKDQPMEFPEHTQLKDLEIKKSVPVPIFDNNLLDEYERSLESLQNELNDLENEMKEAEERVDRAIQVNDTTAWPNNLNFSSVVILKAKTSNFYAFRIDDVAVPTEQDLIPVDNPSARLDLDTKTFFDVHMKQPFDVELLNGHPLSSYVTRNGNHAINAHVTFGELRTPSMKIGGRIDGIVMDEESLLLKSGNDSFTGNIECTDITATDLQTTFINGVSIRDIMANAPTINSPAVLKGNLTINGDLIYNRDLITSTVEGMVLLEYAQDTLKLNSPSEQIVTGRYSIETARVLNMSIDGHLNDVSMEGFPWYLNKPNQIYHVKKGAFSSVDAKNVTVDYSMNDIKVIGKKLDIVTLHEDQVITGPKSFERIHILKTPHDRKNLLEEKSEPFDEETFHYSSMRHGGLLNGGREYLATLRRKRMQLRSMRWTLEEMKMLMDAGEQTQRTYGLEDIVSSVRKLNEYFSDLVSFASIQEHSYHSMDNMVTKLRTLREDFQYSLPMLSQEPFISFYNLTSKAADMAKNMLIKTERDLDNLNKEVINFDKKNFDQDHFSTYTGGFLVSGLISGHDFSKLDKLDYEYSTLKGDLGTKLSEADLVVFEKGLTAKEINRVNINGLLRDSVPFSTPFVDAIFVFVKPVQVMEDFTANCLNGVAASNFALVNGDNEFWRDVIFDNDVYAERGVHVERNVNGFPVRELSDFATVEGDQNFKFTIAFESLAIEGFETGEVTIKSIPLSDFVSRVDAEVTITGAKTFENIHVLGEQTEIKHLKTPFVDDLNLIELKKKKETYVGNYTFNKVTELKSLEVTGDAQVHSFSHLKGHRPVDLTRILRDAYLAGPENALRGDISFNGAVRIQELEFRDSFDCVNTFEFENGFILHGKRQELLGPHTFENLKVETLVLNSGVLQGVNLERLNSSTAKIDESAEFNADLYFGSFETKRGINVSGLVQGWDLTKDAVLVSESPVIIGAKTFNKDTLIKGDFDVKSLLNGMDFNKFCSSVSGEVIIHGPVTFGRDISAKWLKTNGYQIPNDLSPYWRKDADVNISAHLVFHGIEAPNVHITGELNQEPVMDILEGRLSSYRSSSTSAAQRNWEIEYVICNKLVVDDIQVENLNGETSSLINHIIVNNLDQEFDTSLRTDQISVKDLTISGTLNGYQISDFCSGASECVVRGRKRFDGGLNVMDWIMPHRSRMGKLTLAEIEEFPTLPVRVVINGSVEAPAMQVRGPVQGVTVGEEYIMTLSKTQTLRGDLRISNLHKNALKAHRIFVKNGKVNEITFDGHDFTEPESYGDYEYEAEELYEKYLYLMQHVVAATTKLESYTKFNGWERVQTFYGYKIRSLSLHDAFNGISEYIAVISHEGTRILNRLHDSDTFTDHTFIPLNCTTDVTGFTADGASYVVTSADCHNEVPLPGHVSHLSLQDTAIRHLMHSYVWLIEHSRPVLVSALAMNDIQQVEVLRFEESHCVLFVGGLSSPFHNILCKNDKSWVHRQTLDIGPIIKISRVEVPTPDGENTVYIIVASRNMTGGNTLQLLRNRPEDTELVLIQRIPADRLVWVDAKVMDSSLLVVAVFKPFLNSKNGQIKKYRLSSGDEEEKLVLQETLPVHSPKEAVLLHSPHDMLMVADEDNIVHRYVRKGFGKFHEAAKITVPWSQSLHPVIGVLDRGHYLGVHHLDNNKPKIDLLKPTFTRY